MICVTILTGGSSMHDFKDFFWRTWLTSLALVLLVCLMGWANSGCGVLTGSQGKPGVAGPQGTPGNAGVSGPTGPQGTPGTPAASVVPVQLCPEQGAPEYPVRFPESALCVAGKLYGVFWDGTGAWLAELPPGAYRSTATGLGCDFQIKAGCEIVSL